MNETSLAVRYPLLLKSIERGADKSRVAEVMNLAIEARKAGQFEISIGLLSALSKKMPTDARIWQLLGISYRDLQHMEDAWRALNEAARLDPDNPGIAMANAQLHFETGRPSTRLFEKAWRLAPSDLSVTRHAAGAMAAEGDPEPACQLLEDRLTKDPAWLDGHKALSSIRSTSGQMSEFTASYKKACTIKPDNLALRLAWFHAEAQARNWDAARAIIGDGERLFGEQPALAVAKVFIASESGEGAENAALFQSVAHIKDTGLDLARIRHCLRHGLAAQAEAIGSQYIATPAATTFWPYLSLAWRLQNDPRAAWLDGGARYIKTYDLGFSGQELDTLADVLREMHQMRAPYLEQSVRGGTQTDRQLFFRHDPAIQNAKARIVEAIADYIADLPPYDPSHPLLAPRRDSILFEGSWSVRLQSEGYHVCHTHPMGWLSSAFYVSLPPPSELGAAPAGWIRFGTPPPELGLSLPAYGEVQPKRGRLVLFPSTMWHGTLPFADGERLTMAFDVRRPR
jgi:Flp pilus assembly protein TadD